MLIVCTCGFKMREQHTHCPMCGKQLVQARVQNRQPPPMSVKDKKRIEKQRKKEVKIRKANKPLQIIFWVSMTIVGGILLAYFINWGIFDWLQPHSFI